ncbi:hypothetical protein L2E82_22706 [Cichorium intybus]|uniref:Uncharacterized protein n=1 Tax=Cichorium intybus TaxID=13427 RepID=A0ACB9DYY0_CICIN|nr:hypothetical protein L2E82_22706 [Cichorium intybus]
MEVQMEPDRMGFAIMKQKEEKPTLGEEVVWRQALETVVAAPGGNHLLILRLAIGILETGVAGAKGRVNKWW